LMYSEDDAINNQSYDIRHHLWKQNSALLVAASTVAQMLRLVVRTVVP
jgi:hypothetical protein